MPLVRRWMIPIVLLGILLVAGGAVWLSRHPEEIEAYFQRRFEQKMWAAASGPGWVDKKVSAFVIRYRETDQGAAQFDAALPIAYQRVAAFFGDVPGETTVVVYPDAAALKAAAGTDFSGDAAGLFGNLLAFHSPDSWTAQFRGAPVEQLATHEFTHRAVSHVARGRAPKWLNEGLATYLAGQLPPETLQRVARAVSDGDSYSLPELDAAFRSAGRKARLGLGLAYGQAGSIVAYVAGVYGPDRLRQVFAGLGAGQSIDEALKGALGVDRAGLEAAWRRSLAAR